MPEVKHPFRCTMIAALGWILFAGGTANASNPGTADGKAVDESYVIGPGDQLNIRVLGADEISDKPVRVEGNGYFELPLVGKVKAEGLTIEQLEAELTTKLQIYIKHPEVNASVTEFKSQPVSVIGAVKNPGVVRMERPMKLMEVLAASGGIDVDAGSKVTITRSMASGPIQLLGAHLDPSGNSSTAELQLQSLMNAARPEENILIRPNDVISVPRAKLVYVLGEVNKPGGFELHNQETLSVLEAVSLAQGVGHTASTKNARIFRPQPGRDKLEIPVNIKKILEGKAADVSLQANDILFIPNSASKQVVFRGLESAVQIGTGIAIWSRP